MQLRGSGMCRTLGALLLIPSCPVPSMQGGEAWLGCWLTHALIVLQAGFWKADTVPKPPVSRLGSSGTFLPLGMPVCSLPPAHTLAFAMWCHHQIESVSPVLASF